MGKGHGSARKKQKCASYLANRTRIKNKTRKLEARIKHLPEETKEKIRKACPIGRRKEGIYREMPKKAKNM
jgi:hypothetical protein